MATSPWSRTTMTTSHPSFVLHQALNGHVSELPAQQPRHVWLTEPHAACRLGVGQLVFGDDLLDSSDESDLQEMRLWIGIAKVSEDILATALDGVVAHDFFPFASRAL